MALLYLLHPAAQKEYETSVSWYSERSLKAATMFVKGVDKAISDICNNPRHYRNDYKHYYERKVYKYPFTIVYTIEENLQLIIVIAVYHQKRNPDNKYR